MGKTKEWMLRCGRGQLPERLGEILHNADENDLKIMLAMMMAAGEDGRVPPLPELGKLLELEESEIDASLKFWRGAGIIGSVRAAKGGATPSPAAPAKEPEKPQAAPAGVHKTAHRNGILESGVIEGYTTEELTRLMESGRVSPQFVDEAQRIMGKMFNCHDVGILAELVDQFGFEEETVLAILTYTVSLGKKTVRNAEKVAIMFYDEGCTHLDDVVAKISAMEKAQDVTSRIRSMMGIGSRSLTDSEKKMFSTWVDSFGFDIDVIRMAYEITVDAIHQPSPKYMNTIMENWHTAGLRTAADVAEAERQRKEKQKGAANLEKSYDVDEFMNASLQRSIEELK